MIILTYINLQLSYFEDLVSYSFIACTCNASILLLIRSDRDLQRTGRDFHPITWFTCWEVLACFGSGGPVSTVDHHLRPIALLHWLFSTPISAPRWASWCGYQWTWSFIRRHRWLGRCKGWSLAWFALLLVQVCPCSTLKSSKDFVPSFNGPSALIEDS